MIYIAINICNREMNMRVGGLRWEEYSVAGGTYWEYSV